MKKMKAVAPGKHRALIKMVRPAKGKTGAPRTVETMAKTLEFIESFSREAQMDKKERNLVCNKRQFIANMRWVQGFSKNKAIQKWEDAKGNPDIFQERIDGELKIAVEQALEVSKREILRSKQHFRGERRQIGEGFALSLLGGPGPQLDKKSMQLLDHDAPKMFQGKSSRRRRASNDDAATSTKVPSKAHPPAPPPHATSAAASSAAASSAAAARHQRQPPMPTAPAPAPPPPRAHTERRERAQAKPAAPPSAEPKMFQGKSSRRRSASNDDADGDNSREGVGGDGSNTRRSRSSSTRATGGDCTLTKYFTVSPRKPG